MSDKEATILGLIKRDPFISQNELAERTGLSRSAVAGYISSLTKQGKLLGRAYVLPNKKQVICIGGANVDRKMQAIDKLQLGTSNPATSSTSCGGVARNIAENLGRLGLDVSLMTVVGDDHEGKWLLDYTRSYVDIEPSKILPNEVTGTYTAVLDSDGEMAVALADMGIYDRVDLEFTEKRWGFLASTELVMIDTNFPANVLAKVIDRCREEEIPLIITPVSAPKIKKLPQNLEGVVWLIANKDEAEELAGHKIKDEGDFFKAAEAIMKKGVERVVISRGDKGLIYFTKANEAGVLLPPEVDVVDVTGAGDALVAGIVYAHSRGLKTEDACKIGMACSMLTLTTEETVNPTLNHQRLQEAFQHNFN